jgi:hypothetical protein
VILAVGYSYNGKLLLQNLAVVVPAALSTILLFYILFRYNFYVIQIPNQKKIKFFIRSNVFSFLFAIGFSLTISYIVTLCVNLETGKQMFISITLMKDLMTALIVQLITFLIFSLYQNQQSILKNQKLIAENIRTRYEVLKNQVDPHFLFNSLNTLDGLISMDTERTTYLFDHTKKDVKKIKEKYEDGRLVDKGEEPNKYYADNDILTLYFNISDDFKGMPAGAKKVYYAVGANPKDGRVDLIIPHGAKLSEIKEGLEEPKAASYVVVFINQKIFSSERGELWLAFDAKNDCVKATLKDVLFFGDVRGILKN